MNKEEIDNLKKFRQICIRHRAGELIYPDDRVFMTLFRADFPIQCQRIIDRISKWDMQKAEAYLINKFHKWHKAFYIKSFGIDEWNAQVEREKNRVFL